MIEFEAIPSETGWTCLTIYRPGEWFHSNDYRCFVGGEGVGGAKTLKAAKAYLLLRARMYCQRQIDKAESTIVHYKVCLRRLEEFGVLPRVTLREKVAHRRKAESQVKG